MTNHLFQKIRAAVEGRESRLFLETPAGFALTYAEMITLSGRYAEALAELGLKPGDRVAAQVEKSVEALMLYLGAIRAGGFFCPSTPLIQAPNSLIFSATRSRKSLSAIQQGATAWRRSRLGLGWGRWQRSARMVACHFPSDAERARQISRT
jgi:acyl-coenzyme A synthetase/AMP-(fatty) acid ligase